jgi:hypothetical protein
MAADDNVSLGEVVRNIQALTRSVETLSGRVITTDVWSVERQMFDVRMNVAVESITKLATALEKEHTERVAEREKDRLEAKQDREKVQSFRRQITFAVLTSLIAPLIVAAVLLIANPGGS